MFIKTMNLITLSGTSDAYTTTDNSGTWNYIVDEDGVHGVQLTNGKVSLGGSTFDRQFLDCSPEDSLQDLVDSFEFWHNQGVDSEDEVSLTYETI